MKNIVVTAPTWQEFHRREAGLPEDVYITRRTLKSKRVPVRTRGARGTLLSLVSARWPQDGLLSTSVPNLCFVLAGAVALPLGEYTVHCLPGHALLMPPGTPYPDGSHLCIDESRMMSGSCKLLSLRPWGGGVECWLSHTQDKKHWSYLNPREHCYVQNVQAQWYLENFNEEAQACLYGYQSLCDGLLTALFAVLTREIRRQHTLNITPQEKGSSRLASQSHLREHHPIRRAQRYIDAHLNEALTIDRIAGHVYMSRAYFTRCFRQVTQKSVVEYITESRLRKAKMLLVNTQWPIAQISASVGVSVDRLRNIFLQYEKQTPTEFRRQNNVER